VYSVFLFNRVIDNLFDPFVNYTDLEYDILFYVDAKRDFISRHGFLETGVVAMIPVLRDGSVLVDPLIKSEFVSNLSSIGDENICDGWEVISDNFMRFGNMDYAIVNDLSFEVLLLSGLQDVRSVFFDVEKRSVYFDE
jgi:hypothetical protein